MLIVGCGYLGCRLAAGLKEAHSVVGLVQTDEGLARLASIGIEGIQTDLDGKINLGRSLRDESVFYFAPPPRQGVVDSRMTKFLAACEASGYPKKMVYLSTTGVYGDCQGVWVDENHPVHPVVDRAKRRWDAEQQVRKWCEPRGVEFVILRVAGIYGPGKLPLARLKKQLPLVKAEEAPYTNRIHVDDLIQVCSAAMEKGETGEVYNASDGHPGTMLDYFNQVADFAGLPRPPTISMQEADQKLSAGMMSYMQESRRIDNKKVIKELGIKFLYPNLSSGLPACGLENLMPGV